MQKTKQLIEELEQLGCSVKIKKTKHGYTSKVFFPYTDLKSNLKKFDPNPQIVTYYHGTEECLRLHCCNSPTAYGITNVNALLSYYAYITKTNNPDKLPLRSGTVLTNPHTVNTVLRPIDLICWRKGYFSVMVNIKTNSVRVISNDVKNNSRKSSKRFSFRVG